MRLVLVLALVPLAALSFAWASTGIDAPRRSAATVRAERRAYDGAPPVIPHAPFGSPCVSCHNREGMAVENLGFAPPMPHAETAGIGITARCEQCHVFRRSDDVMVGSTFAGLPQALRPGHRASPGAPPVVPHALFMREACLACHGGPAAREGVRTSHPERARCRQCHVAAVTKD